jgi:hypothetical protein
MSLMVTVRVVLHPTEFVYVIVVVPDAIPVTSPVDETVATPVLLEVQGFEIAGVPEPVSWEVALIHNVVAPLIVGLALTVTVVVVGQPLELLYVIVVVPAATAVTKPVFEIVATAVFELTHGLTAAGAPGPANCEVAPTQSVVVPVITPPDAKLAEPVKYNVNGLVVAE